MSEEPRRRDLWRRLLYSPFDISGLVKALSSLPQQLIKNILQPILQLTPLRLITSPPRNLPRLQVAGLENLGNTCFLNAMLQALASLPSMVRYVNQIAQRQEQLLQREKTFIRQLSKCLNGSLFISVDLSFSHPASAVRFKNQARTVRECKGDLSTDHSQSQRTWRL
jgi:ubiquitin C-terminal hydrolase